MFNSIQATKQVKEQQPIPNTVIASNQVIRSSRKV